MSVNLRSALRMILGLSAALLLCMLLLCGCGEKTPVPAVSDGDAAVTDGDAWATDGDLWSTDGDAWATDGSAWATDGSASAGNAVFFASDSTTEELDAAESIYATDGNALTTKEVRVSTVDQLLDAAASDTAVILAPGTYDLSSVEPLSRPGCYWRPVYGGGYELVFTGLANFALRGESGKAEDVIILCSPRMADVMTFDGCSNIQLTGLTMGHTQLEESACGAGVLHLTGYTSSVYVANCDLYGCGTTGISAENITALTVKSSVIHDCIYDAMSLSDSSYILVDDCELRNCGSNDVFSIYGCSWVTVRNSLIHENTTPVLFYSGNSNAVSFECCEIGGNSFEALYSVYGSAVDLNSCTFPLTTYARDYLDFYEGSSLVRVNGTELEYKP